MRTSTLSVAIAVISQPINAAISPDYHALMWKFGDANFWSPLGLNTTKYAFESPAGAAPDALSKRKAPNIEADQYLPCTVVTLDGELSGAALETQLARYRALNDDVWSEEQVSFVASLQNYSTDEVEVHGLPPCTVDSQCAVRSGFDFCDRFHQRPQVLSYLRRESIRYHGPFELFKSIFCIINHYSAEWTLCHECGLFRGYHECHASLRTS
jgi:hypothetical protein